MAALVAVMIFVSVATFDWHSIRPRTLKMMPKSEPIVMLATVIGTVGTHNLAIDVGVLVAMVLFARRVAHFVTVERTVKTIEGRETGDAEGLGSCSADSGILCQVWIREGKINESPLRAIYSPGRVGVAGSFGPTALAWAINWWRYSWYSMAS